MRKVTAEQAAAAAFSAAKYAEQEVERAWQVGGQYNLARLHAARLKRAADGKEENTVKMEELAVAADDAFAAAKYAELEVERAWQLGGRYNRARLQADRLKGAADEAERAFSLAFDADIAETASS